MGICWGFCRVFNVEDGFSYKGCQLVTGGVTCAHCRVPHEPTGHVYDLRFGLEGEGFTSKSDKVFVAAITVPQAQARLHLRSPCLCLMATAFPSVLLLFCPTELR